MKSVPTLVSGPRRFNKSVPTLISRPRRFVKSVPTEGGGGRDGNSASSLKKTQFKHIHIYKTDQIAN